ncbi:hypothetical protein HPB50_001192 [Hyalomma asiaticum]|uniref:Uncharacterized protein n=1 Tax=Hyalomma asiaticum TaxID=266040 RepID=A0ACB7SA86_HYAAI|nr:hypothetical protein HPB50_001192 [Hyalomma asiaticum]
MVRPWHRDDSAAVAPPSRQVTRERRKREDERSGSPMHPTQTPHDKTFIAMAGGPLVRRWNGCAHVPQHGPDSVHSWLVAGACALACFFAMAGRRSAGFLFVAILDTFQVNRSDGSWPIMLMGGLVYLAGR